MAQIPTIIFAEEVCLPPFAIEIDEAVTEIPNLSLLDEEEILQLSYRTQADYQILNQDVENEEIQHVAVQSLSEFIADTPSQLHLKMKEYLREFYMSYQSFQSTDVTESSATQPDIDKLITHPASLPAYSEHATVKPTPNRAIVIRPQITRLVISFSSTEKNSLLSVGLSTQLIYTDMYSNPYQQKVISSNGYGQQKIVVEHDSTVQQLIERVKNAMNTALNVSIDIAIEKARRSILREYSRHLATDNSLAFIAVGSSKSISVGTKLQIVSTNNNAEDICDSEKFFGLLQVAERYDDYLVAYTRGEFTVPPNALLITKPETIAIQPLIYTLIPAIEFAGYTNVQQIVLGVGARLYTRIDINRLQPFFALTVDTVVENEGVLLPLHGWVGLGMNWYSGRVTVSPRLSGGIGFGSYFINTESVTSFFISGLATVQGSLLLHAALELGLELGYQFSLPLSDTTTIHSQSLQTGYGGIFIGGTITFFD